MAALTTVVGGATILLSTSALLFRRRISRNWISVNPTLTKTLQSNEAIIITGGNCGLGFETAKDLAGRIGNGKIILACRNYENGESAASMIRESSGNLNVECMRLDLASSDSIRQFASDLTPRGMRIVRSNWIFLHWYVMQVYGCPWSRNERRKKAMRFILVWITLVTFLSSNHFYQSWRSQNWKIGELYLCREEVKIGR